jgi:hypothetical protein
MDRTAGLTALGLTLALGAGCGGGSDGPAAVSDFSGSGSGSACLVPEDRLVSGGPGRDGIPALDNPVVVSAAEGDTFLLPTALVLGVVENGEARAYPHNVLWWHEIVNDTLGGVRIVVSYCPLTGSGMVYDPRIGGQVLNFGVSGLLFENNLVLFDRATESLWSQMGVQGVCGSFSGTAPALRPIVQSTWEAWKAMHPNTTVVSFDTGFGRNYGVYPYGNYDRVGDNSLLFPAASIDRRRPLKELALGIVESGVEKAYPYGRWTSPGGGLRRRGRDGPGLRPADGRRDPHLRDRGLGGLPLPPPGRRDRESMDARRGGRGRPSRRVEGPADRHLLGDVVRLGCLPSRHGDLQQLSPDERRRMDRPRLILAVEGRAWPPAASSGI